MDTVQYILSIAAVAVCAVLWPRFDRIFSLAVAVLLGFSAGLRTEGFDFDNYQVTIQHVLGQPIQSLQDGLELLRDPFFTAIVLMCNEVSSDEQMVFLVIAILSSITKWVAIQRLPRNQTHVIGLYAIFLAPGLEFAAIRSGLALGFCALALAVVGRGAKVAGVRTLLWLCALASHLSAGMIPIFSIASARVSLRTILYVGPGVALFTFLILSLDLFGWVAQSDSYYQDRGTLSNFFFPAITLTVLAFFYPVLQKYSSDSLRDGSLGFSRRQFAVSYLLVCSTVGAALPVSTFVVRILEFAWFSYLISVAEFSCERRVGIFRTGLWLFVPLMVLVNLYRETWTNMFPWNPW